MSRTAWSLYDSEEDETYFFEVNPYEDSGSFAHNKSMRYTVSGASFYTDNNNIERIGDTLMMIEPDELEKFSFKGRTYTAEQLEDLGDWCNRPYPLTLADDLGRSWLVYITGLSVSRVRKNNRWKHEYTFEGIVLEEL